MKICCSTLIAINEEKLIHYIDNLLSNAGFTPTHYDYLKDNFSKLKSDIVFHEKKVMKLLKNKVQSLTLKSGTYDEESINATSWLRLSFNINKDEFKETIGNTFSIEWSNRNLNILFESNFFKDIVSSNELIYCYIYNSEHISNGSMTNKLDFPFTTTQNLGRIERVRSINFVAASTMWFGPAFEFVYKLDSLSKFKYAQWIDNSVFIRLFELDEKIENIRGKQKEYWDVLVDNKIVDQYEKANKFDFTKWLLSQTKK